MTKGTDKPIYYINSKAKDSQGVVHNKGSKAAFVITNTCLTCPLRRRSKEKKKRKNRKKEILEMDTNELEKRWGT